MKTLQKIFRFLRILLFAFLFAVCMVMGIVPVMPKRKNEYVVEEKIVEEEDLEDATSSSDFRS